jgi:pimeloyl-ACP methyl ester carboxylesterase
MSVTENPELKIVLPEALSALEKRSNRVETPCGDGTMVWHIWGDGPNLVLFHGGAGSWHHWVRNIPVLAKSYRLIVPDLPGLGESAVPPEPHTADQFAKIVADGLAVIIGPDATYDLAGFSFGGLIATHLAELQPARVRSLTIIGSGGLRVPNNPMEFVRVRGKPPAEQWDAHRTNLGRMMITDPARIDDTAVAIHALNVRRSRVQTPSLYSLGRMSEIIAKLPMPVNGIWGATDLTAVPRVHEREEALRELSSNVAFRQVEGGGHWVLYEAADDFNEALLELLKRSRPTA